ncbi:hypothetical protein Sp245p_25130 (plasmid) [Azospirillum baldaniorum]|uniref:Uncharacterized protein n=1 Tax=Azospirillum baldaniorum TaxID=1064539 RepID=A0A9P1JYL8_9PROT|nr:hypothetical protein Sp245p_25130 [Azospirillum baldaniorum]CCD02281.1 protein of unknown function [Azospirillum baldaniorum]
MRKKPHNMHGFICDYFKTFCRLDAIGMLEFYIHKRSEPPAAENYQRCDARQNANLPVYRFISNASW